MGLANLCAVGEGRGHTAAAAAAREALAKVFATKIKGHFALEKESDGLEAHERSFAHIQETLPPQLLKGAVILKTFEREGRMYALAALDKRRAGEQFRDEIRHLDDRIGHHYRHGSRSSLAKGIDLLKERRGWHIRYKLMTGKGLPPRVGLPAFLKKRAQRRRANGNTTVLVIVDAPRRQGELKEVIVQYLLEDGLRVATDRRQQGQQDKHDLALMVKAQTKRLHMNVAGFEKHDFSWELTAKRKKKVVGSLNFSHVAVGRTLEQAYEKAFSHLKRSIATHLDELNMGE